jgi:hypothetical protein
LVPLSSEILSRTTQDFNPQLTQHKKQLPLENKDNQQSWIKQDKGDTSIVEEQDTYLKTVEPHEIIPRIASLPHPSLQPATHMKTFPSP